MRIIIAMLLAIAVFYLVQLGLFIILNQFGAPNISLGVLLVLPLPATGAFVVYIAILFGTPLSDIIEKIINPGRKID